MKRSLPIVAIAVLALLVPASVLAAPSPTTTARYFEIRGLVLHGVKTEASGKLAIDGGQLSASAGCNMIGGPVTLDGDVVTLVGPTFMTEMACPGAAGDAEAVLIKILQLGTFTITEGGWLADGGEILTVELTSSGPGAAGSPPDQPVASSPGASASCPPVPTGTNSTIVDGGPAAGSGSGSSSSGGATGSGGSTEPDPGSKPGSAPGATPAIDVPPPAPNPGEESSPGPADPEASPAFILPDPIGQDPNVGKPAGEICQGFAAGGVVEDITGVPKAVDVAAEHASRDEERTALGRALGLAGLLVIGLGAWFSQRRRATPR